MRFRACAPKERSCMPAGRWRWPRAGSWGRMASSTRTARRLASSSTAPLAIRDRGVSDEVVEVRGRRRPHLQVADGELRRIDAHAEREWRSMRIGKLESLRGLLEEERAERHREAPAPRDAILVGVSRIDDRRVEGP